MNRFVKKTGIANNIAKQFVFFVTFFFLFVNFRANAEIVNFYTPQKNWSVTNGLSFENGADFAPLTSSVDISLALDMNEIKANFGNSYKSGQTDVSTNVIYAPTFFNCFNVGAETILHFVDYKDVFVEFDFLSGIYLSYHTAKKFDCMLNFLYHGKAARIFAIQDEVPWLKNNTIAFKTEVNFRPIEKLNLNFSVSSYSAYRYMLWLAPDFSFSADYKFIDMFSIGSQIEIQYIDMFTLSSNLNSIDLRFYLRLEF